MACGHDRRMAVAGMSARTFPRSGDVRVATINVWGWYFPTDAGIDLADPDSDPPEEWTRRQKALRAGLRALRPDLVAFQEVISRDGYDQAADLLGPDYDVWHQAGREADGSGNSIASLWPLGEVRDVDLHVTSRVDPRELAGRVTISEICAPEAVAPLLFVNHKPSYQLAFEHERELQAVAAAQIVEDLVDGHRPHVVLAGDFDAEPDMASMRFWRGRQSLGGMSVCYRDAWSDAHPAAPGHTFTPDNPMVRQGNWPLERGRRIDHILVRCGQHGPTLEITACERIFDVPVDGVWASDHFGVVVDLAAPA
jgi:endonuclease/exonuclease/phosphatase family metal-dependent hydrolase